MLGVSLCAACGDMLGLALKERIGESFKDPVLLVVGKDSDRLSLSGWRVERLADPMKLAGTLDYDVIVCVQALESLRSLEVASEGGKLCAVRDGAIVPLTPAQEKLAKEHLKVAGISLKKGQRALVPVELEGFLKRAKAALKTGGVILFIDFMSPAVVRKVANSLGFSYFDDKLSHFLSRAPMGKVRVLNNNPALAFYPHPVRDDVANRIVAKNIPFGCIRAFLDVEKSLSSADKLVVEPFIANFALVFSGWSELVREKLAAARKIETALSNRDELSELYSTLNLLGYDVSSGFLEKWWEKAQQMLGVPEDMPLYAASVSLHGKVI
jgi:hypothetical protein